MRDQRVFDIARRYPHARALEEIVAAAFEPEEAIVVSTIDVAGRDPTVMDQLGGLVGLVEVVRNRTAAFHLQPAAAGALQPVAVLIGDDHLVAFQRQPRASRATAAGEVMDEAMQELGGAKALKDVDAAHFLPVVPGRD